MSLPILPVYVSSTWLDLEPERRAVEQAIQRLRETKFVGMEYGGETTPQAALDEIDRSSVYVCLLAGRYGSGLTEAQYDRARERGLPCFIYFKDEATIPAEWREIEPERLAKLDAFKQKLRANQFISVFRGPEDLATKVATDLHRWLFDNYLTPKLQGALRSGVSRGEAQALPDTVKDMNVLGRELAARDQRHPRRRWIIPAVIAALLFLGGVAGNLVAGDLYLVPRQYRFLIWVFFLVALGITFILAARDIEEDKSPDSRNEPASKNGPHPAPDRTVVAGEVKEGGTVVVKLPWVGAALRQDAADVTPERPGGADVPPQIDDNVPSRIFICYRRGIGVGHAAGRLYDRLAKHFGEERVFMDISAIEVGDDFVDVITRELSSCAFMLVLIHRGWADTKETDGRRLHEEHDFVRMEVSTALKRNIRVIPVLLDGAPMPRAGELPEDLRALARRNAFKISGESWSRDVNELLARMEGQMLR